MWTIQPCLSSKGRILGTMARYTRIPSSSLRVAGADRLDFLMGQMTGHLKNVPTPGRVPALFLNVKGQIEHVAQVYRRESDIYIHLPEDEAALLAARFKKYIVFDQVEVEDTTETLATFHLWGEDTETSLPGWSPEGPDVQHIQWDEDFTVLAARVRRTENVGLDLHILRSKVLDFYDFIKLDEAAWEEVQMERILAGIPDPLIDGFTGDLPQQCGMEYAVSYKKGCYIGQEIMARLEARGNTRYRLVRLRGEDISSHTEIQRDDKVVGRTGLSLGDTCLAVVRKEVDFGQTVKIEEAYANVHELQIPDLI